MIDVVRALDEAGIDAVDLNRRQATLDDVFLTLTGTRRNHRRGVRMTTTTQPDLIAAPSQPSARGRTSTWPPPSFRTGSDSLVFAGRNIEHIRQIPEKLLDVTIQPLMFVLLFAYVFGGAINVRAATTASTSSAGSSSSRSRSGWSARRPRSRPTSPKA